MQASLVLSACWEGAVRIHWRGFMQPKGTCSAPSILPLTAPLCSLAKWGLQLSHQQRLWDLEGVRRTKSLSPSFITWKDGWGREMRRGGGNGEVERSGQCYLTVPVLTAPTNAHLPGARLLTTENSVSGATLKATPFILWPTRAFLDSALLCVKLSSDN